MHAALDFTDADAIPNCRKHVWRRRSDCDDLLRRRLNENVERRRRRLDGGRRRRKPGGEPPNWPINWQTIRRGEKRRPRQMRRPR